MIVVFLLSKCEIRNSDLQRITAPLRSIVEYSNDDERHSDEVEDDNMANQEVGRIAFLLGILNLFSGILERRRRRAHSNGLDQCQETRAYRGSKMCSAFQ